MAQKLPSLERLHELFDYEPATGVLRWKYRNDVPDWWNTKHAGKVAGCAKRNKRNVYQVVCIDHIRFGAHRICFKMHHRRDPVGEVDHKDCDGLNNRGDNLRESTLIQNSFNRRRKRGHKLPKGVNRRSDKFYAKITLRGRQIHLGAYATPEGAGAAYAAASKKYHGEFGRVA